MQDQPNVPTAPDSESGKVKIKPVKKTHLINKLNYINFQEGTIQIVFEHSKYNHTVSLNAKPQPCLGEELECIWPESELETYRTLNAYRFREIQVPDGKNALIVRPEDIFINGKVANFLLPETVYELRYRGLQRYFCDDIQAQVVQNSIAFQGKLLDFNVSCFHVQLDEDQGQTLSWVNNTAALNLILSNDKGIVFSGECKVTQVRNGYEEKEELCLGTAGAQDSAIQAKGVQGQPYQTCSIPLYYFPAPLFK